MIDDLDSDLAAAVLEEFGERAAGRDIIFRRQDADGVSLDGIFDEAFVSIRQDGAADVSDVSPSILVAIDALPVPPDEFVTSDRFIVRGLAYQPWDARPAHGMTRILLKEV